MYGTVATTRLARIDVDTSARKASIVNLGNAGSADLSIAEALLATEAFHPVDSGWLIERIASAIGEDPFIVAQRLLNLIDLGFIEVIDSSSVQKPDPRIVEKSLWANMGWSVDFDYLIACMDHKFFGGDEDGLAESAQTMLLYAVNQYDDCRAKRFIGAGPSIALPSLAHMVSDWTPPAVWGVEQRLCALASSLVAPVKRTQPKWGGAPLFRKMHPSGGARHPTEAYLSIPISLGPLMAGHYHVQCDPLELVTLPLSLTEVPLHRIEPLFNRVPFKILGALTLTSCFGRNRYRYRESRTYRTVHMDVGHILANVEALARPLSLKVFATYTWDSPTTEALTGTSYLEEGVLATVFLGDDSA